MKRPSCQTSMPRAAPGGPNGRQIRERVRALDQADGQYGHCHPCTATPKPACAPGRDGFCCGSAESLTVRFAMASPARDLSFESIHREFRPKVLRYLGSFVGIDDAADLTQVVMLKLSEHLHAFRGESSLAPGPIASRPTCRSTGCGSANPSASRSISTRRMKSRTPARRLRFGLAAPGRAARSRARGRKVRSQ